MGGYVLGGERVVAGERGEVEAQRDRVCQEVNIDDLRNYQGMGAAHANRL